MSDLTFVQQSRVLNALRFPLACMVVIIHCKINPENWILPNWFQLTGEEFSAAIQILLSTIFSGVAVPTFYLLSGYFFFYHIKSFNLYIYI